MAAQQKNTIIFTDIGDTIIDERTEERDARGIVMRAQCIPGARETYLGLYEAGYTIVMVADGQVESFHNTMTQHGLAHIFAARIISDEVGEQKPSQRMFRAAMDALHLTESDKDRIVMVGNNVKKDILGGNLFGIRTILLDWSTLRPYDESRPEEHATWRIHSPEELTGLIERFEAENR